MFRWIQDGIEWVLQLICGHGWTGGVEGALPFAVVCGMIFVVGLYTLFKSNPNCEELQGVADGEFGNLGASAMFFSWFLFILLFAAMYYSRSKNFVFVFALITGGTPKEFTPTPYNFGEWPLRMKIILVVAVLFWIWSVYRCKYEKKPLRALLDKFFVVGAMTAFIICYFYLRELTDESGKSYGFEWLCMPLDLAVWVFLAILPVAAAISPAYVEKDPPKPRPQPASDGYSPPSRALSTGSIIRDSEGHSCRIRRDGEFVYISRPDGSEEQVYAYEFDSGSSITTSAGHHYTY